MISPLEDGRWRQVFIREEDLAPSRPDRDHASEATGRSPSYSDDDAVQHLLIHGKPPPHPASPPMAYPSPPVASPCRSSPLEEQQGTGSLDDNLWALAQAASPTLHRPRH